MLREEVLNSWRNYKQKITKLVKDIDFLDEQTLVETALPQFPLDLNAARQNLDRWTNTQFRIKIDENKRKVLEVAEGKLGGWASSYLNSISMFKDLTKGWKKEKDSYARYRNNNTGSGPTIEEVDDW